MIKALSAVNWKRFTFMSCAQFLLLWAIVPLFSANKCYAVETRLQTFAEQQIGQATEQHPAIPARGLLAIQNGQVVFSATSGFASKDKNRPFGAHTPVRIASNTKTYVAVAAFVLIEQNKLSLSQPIKPLLSSEINELLVDAGYQPEAITVGQLIAHTSGMRDHTTQKAFLDSLINQPEYQWRPEEHIAAMAKIGAPLAAPGVKYQYSDTGYIILGQIIENVMEMHLSDAVQTLVDLKQTGIRHTWWETFDKKPETAEDRAHQYLNDMDSYHWHPSFDLYGGGGLVSTLYDMALFTDALFDGQYFEQNETLLMMQNPEDLPAPDQYLYGLTVSELAGEKAIGHSGFWGTFSLYFPSLDMTIAGVVTAQEGYKAMLKDVENIVRFVKESGPKSIAMD